jgi:hypothetical protein
MRSWVLPAGPRDTRLTPAGLTLSGRADGGIAAVEPGP